MAYNAISSLLIQAGKALKQELMSLVKDNFDDHESRLTTVEGVVNVYRPIRFRVTNYEEFVPATEVDVERIPFAMTLQGVRLLVLDAGSAGTVEVNLEYKRGGGAWTNILTTNPSVAFGAGDYALSSNGVLSVTSLQAGDLLRLNIVTAQTGNEEIIVYVDFEKT